MNYAKLERNKNERNGASCIILHQDSTVRRSGDFDRGSIRVFETQLASQSDGTWLSGSRDAQKAVSEFVIRVAKENGLFIPEEELSTLGERKRLPSGESIIFENAVQGVVYKVRDPFAKLHLKSGRAADVLYDHIVHNLLFPKANYTLVGVSSVLGEVRFVLAQPFFFYTEVPTQQQIEDALKALGLFKEDNYYYGNEYVSVTDVDSTGDNVILQDDGELFFIDPIIKMKKPIDEIINFYCSFNGIDVTPHTSQSFFDKLKSLFSFIRFR